MNEPIESTIPSLPEAGFVVIFGGSGDLAKRKLLPALARLRTEGLLPKEFAILSVGRSPLTDETFRSRAGRASQAILENLHYCQADYTPEGARVVDARMKEIAAERGLPLNALFYLSVPPDTFQPIIASLSEAGLVKEHCNGRGWSRVIIEKPFGRDLASARKLNADILPHLTEHQIYRIDHYLGKEGVQNLLVFRFANPIFEPIWSARHIDNIQITAAETLGVEGRGGYYETAGVLRDMIQNHLMQVLCLTCMEPPASLSPDDVRNEKVKVLKALRPLVLSGEDSDVVRGQYGPGRVEEQEVPGYRDEPDVPETSTTETFAALRCHIDNFRWAGVPIYLRSGKRMGHKGTQITINFKEGAKILFNALPGVVPPRNRIIFHIQPEEGILLELGTKRPGQSIRIERTAMDFAYREAFEHDSPEAYERLLLDAWRGDATLFVRSDEAELSWKYLQPVIEKWSTTSGKSKIPLYPAGTDGPEAAEGLLARDGREWVDFVQST
ncbi:MAG: glucose-6-phosphate dehydrogenase [Fibrobacteria bacterium]|nr:glucose-6-phosphate dehydrogenase [Fibrobacteria bacterium]